MAASLLWILDAGNNTAMEPYRAFVADKLNEDQQPTGFQMQSFFTGLGQTLANLSLFIFPLIFVGKTGSLPTWVYASFFLGSLCSIGSIWWSIKTTPEIEPDAEELAHIRSQNHGALDSLKEIFQAIGEMPKVMWQLALVYLFQWYALFCYWQNSSKSIALSVWNATPSENPAQYEEAVSWTGLVNGWYNVVTFLSALFLARLAQKHGAKMVHLICLIVAAAGFLAFPMIADKNLLFIAITGFGIGWASMMGIPYLLVVNDIPKERYGVYMGIINMMIVIPMILQNITFGYILKNFLGNDSRNAITFAGILLILSAVATGLIKSKKEINE
ncbi:MAG: hypothetical protein RI995_967 [Bacteroidota bacterium]